MSLGEEPSEEIQKSVDEDGRPKFLNVSVGDGSYWSCLFWRAAAGGTYWLNGYKPLMFLDLGPTQADMRLYDTAGIPR